MPRLLAAAVCGCAIGAISGCGRPTSVPATGAATNRDGARQIAVAPRSSPVSNAISVGDVAHPQLVCVDYPSQGPALNDPPRIRLAQVQPLPLAADGPDLEPPQPTGSTPGSEQAGIVPLPPMPPRITAPAITQSVIAEPVVAQPTIVPPAIAALPAVQPNPPAAATVNVETMPGSAELDAVVRQADTRTARAFELAQRGAIYSARAEFIAALHTIAASLDSASNGNSHQQMLAAGLRALDEADDFANQNSDQNPADVSQIVGGHQTPVLKDVPLSGISCSAAMSRYLTFAQEQLAGCSAGIPAGSAALYGLGKIYCLPESMHGPADATHGAKAVALHQAALLVDSRNYRSANELGVLLAKFGRLPEARVALLHGIAMYPTVTTWRNLAAVHQSLGQRDLAARAYQESLWASARQNRTGMHPSAYTVQWLDPATFAATTPLNIDGTPPAKSVQQNSMAAGPSAAAIR